MKTQPFNNLDEFIESLRKHLLDVDSYVVTNQASQETAPGHPPGSQVMVKRTEIVIRTVKYPKEEN